MPTNFRSVISAVLLIDMSSGSSFSIGFLDCIFFLIWSMWPFSMATLFGRYLVTSCTVSTGHDWKYPFWISLIHVDLAGLNAAPCSYLTKYFWFVMWYMLLILCYMYLSSYECLFSKGTLYNQVFFFLSQLRLFFNNWLCVRLFMWRLPCTLHHTYFRWISMNCMSVLLLYVPARRQG